MPQLFVRLCYNMLIYLITVPALLYLLWRSGKDRGYRQRLSERFALQSIPANARGGIVVHAVSVGEVVAAIPLIKALQLTYPKLRLTVSCTTPTASERIVKTFGSSIYHCYLPLDTPGAIARWLNKLQPQALIVLETELWPNLLQHCRRALIPTIVVNARMSGRSARGYRRWYSFSRLALDNISLLLAQDDATARRFAALGCNAQQQVCGNLKFDMAQPMQSDSVLEQYKLQFAGRQVWVAGSTHAGEDELLIAAYQQLKLQFPQLLLVIVPRHPERFNRVAQQLQQAGLNTARRSDNSPVNAATEVFLGDSMGELLLWYQLADLVFIGGSLINRGGHNPLEAMCFGKAIQTGPHVFNFAQAYQWLAQAGALNWTANVQELTASTAQLLRQPQLAAGQGEKALALYLQHGGATQRMSQAITRYLGLDCCDLRIAVQPSAISWYQADVFHSADELSFMPAFWQQQNAIIGQSQGRNTAWFIRHNAVEFVLRHYYRGGFIGKLIQDKFSYQSVLSSRAMQEYALLRHMRRCGLPVPRPLAAQYCPTGLHYRSDLIIELISNSRDVATLLASGDSLSAAQWFQLGSMIGRFHQHGVYHSDLNCHNILLDADGKFWLIDFDKCALREPGSWQEKNLARLQRSLVKERSSQSQFCWHPDHWQALLQGYNWQLTEEKW
jgi:3-deoxy-D-manno-octulosonic-acid transferase